MARTGPRKKVLPGRVPEHLKPYASVPGRRVCQKCCREFLSPDRTRIRTCPECAKQNVEEGPSCRTSGVAHLPGDGSSSTFDDEPLGELF